MLEAVDCKGHIIDETLVVEEKVGAAFRKVIVEFLGHAGDETCDSVFDVIFLPVHVGIAINPQLLVQETIGRFDTFLGDHGYEGVNHNLAAKIANSFHLAKLLGNNLYLCITFLAGWDFFVIFAAKKRNMIQQLHGYWPRIGEGTFVAETAAVIGDVVIGRESSVWYSAVIRGDVNRIRIGDRVSIQDCTCLHCAEGDAYIEIGNDVTVGHNVCLHGCKIADNVLIGMGATVLDNVKVDSGSVVAAGALVLSGTHIGPGELWGGVPAKLIKKLDQEAIDRIITPMPQHYQYWAAEYLKEQAAAAPDLSLD